MTDMSVGEWRLSVIAELVWEALPEQERAKSWEDVAVRAVHVYEQNISRWQDGDSMFMTQKDDFIASQNIYNRRHEIRRYLENDGRYIGWFAGKDGRIYRTSDVAPIVQFRQRQMEGMINGYNAMVEGVSDRHPELEIVRYTEALLLDNGSE